MAGSQSLQKNLDKAHLPHHPGEEAETWRARQGGTITPHLPSCFSVSLSWSRWPHLPEFERQLRFNIVCIGEGNGTPLQYSCLANPMDGGAWKAAVHGVAEGWTRLSNFTFTFHFAALGKEMATHSSVLAWRIPGTEQPGGLPAMGSHRVGYD